MAKTKGTKQEKATKKQEKKMEIKAEPAIEVKPTEKKIPSSTKSNPMMQFINRYKWVLGLLLGLLLIGGYAAQKWLVVATVNGTTINRFEYNKALEAKAGKQTMDDLVMQTLINQEAQKQGISISQEEINQEMAVLESQFNEQMPLDQVLASQGMTRADLEKQIGIKKTVEKLAGQQINPSDEEIAKFLTDNKASIPETLKEADQKEWAKQQIAQSKQSEQIQTYLESLRQQAVITYN